MKELEISNDITVEQYLSPKPSFKSIEYVHMIFEWEQK